MLKKLTYSKAVILLLSVLLTGVIARSCMAIGEPVYDYLNHVENAATATATAKMLINEAQMLQMQITSMERLGHYNYQDLARVLRRLQDITKRGKALSYSMSDLDSKFTNYYPNYNKHGKLVAYKAAYSTWNETSLQTFQNTLAAIGVSAHETENEQTLLENLKKQSQTEQGQTRLLQISHELAINTNQHLSSLQEIISAQTNAQTAYMSHKVSRESYEDESMDELVENAKNYHIPKKGQSYGKLNFDLRRSA